MIKANILKAKIKRSNAQLKNTHIYDPESSVSDLCLFSKLFLRRTEDIILYHSDENENNWILTNQRLIFPVNMVDIDISKIKDVFFDNVHDNPEQKMTNTELVLQTENEKIKLFAEEGTWPLIYEVFKFIINSKK